MLTADGWLDWAEHAPGPPGKVNAERNIGVGLVCHSMEGWLAGSMAELLKPNRQASWHFSNCLDGRFLQHYPVHASCWASGNARANRELWAVESEGVAGVPLNEAQVANMLRLAREWESYRSDKASPRVATRRPAGRSVWQHNEVWNWQSENAGPTACPSGRYEPFFKELEVWMTTNERICLASGSGDYDQMLADYDALAAQGLVPPASALPPDAEFSVVLNDAIMKRFTIINLAATNPDAAASVIGD